MQIERELAEILFSQSYAALGTASNEGIPWVSPVVYTFNRKIELVWASALDCRHSENLRTNGSLSFCIYDSAQPQNSPQGVYGEGKAHEIRDDLDQAATDFYRWRYPHREDFERKRRSGAAFRGDFPRRLFRATGLQLYGISREGHPNHGPLVDFRIPVDVSETFSESWEGRFR